jgi:PEP-CTERM motif
MFYGLRPNTRSISIGVMFSAVFSSAVAGVMPVWTQRYVEVGHFQTFSYGPNSPYSGTGTFVDSMTQHFSKDVGNDGTSATLWSSQKSDVNTSSGRLQGALKSSYVGDSAGQNRGAEAAFAAVFYLDQDFNYTVSGQVQGQPGPFATGPIQGPWSWGAMAAAFLYSSDAQGHTVGAYSFYEDAIDTSLLFSHSGALTAGYYTFGAWANATWGGGWTDVEAITRFTLDLTSADGRGNTVPEPSTLALLGVAALACSQRREYRPVAKTTSSKSST